MAGQVAELAHEALPREYRSVATTQAKILLIEAGPEVLAAFAPKLQRYTRRRLQRMGVEVCAEYRGASHGHLQRHGQGS